jgi:hypothetical protein
LANVGRWRIALKRRRQPILLDYISFVLGQPVSGELLRDASLNAEQVRLASKIIEGLALEVAPSDDAREVLHLKGGDSLQA